MKWLIKYSFIILYIIVISGCKAPKENSITQTNESSEPKIVIINELKFLADVPGIFLHHEIWRGWDYYVDQYNNSYQSDRGMLRNIYCQLKNNIDIDVLLQVHNYINHLTIRSSDPIIDNDFLRLFTQLEILEIGIMSAEIDCSIFIDFKKLKRLSISSDIKLINFEVLLELADLEIISGDYIRVNDTRNAHVIDFIPGIYHILQYRANVRTEPSRNGDIIKILSLFDEVEILENSLIAEKINGVWAYWYKIKLGSIIGYTFGGNMAYNSLVTDIDKNGINDYFFWQYSQDEYGTYKVNPLTDVIIYINNQRIDTSTFSSLAIGIYNWQWAHFEEKDDYVLVEFRMEGGDTSLVDLYKVISDGIIEHVNYEDYW
jgi:hypothetical protein